MKITRKKLRETINKIILFENLTNEDKILKLIDTADPAYVQQGIILAESIGLIDLFEEEEIESRGFGTFGSKVYRFFCLSQSFYAELNKMQYKHQGQSFRSKTNMLIECYGGSGNEVYIRVFDKYLTPDLDLDAFFDATANETRMYAGSLISSQVNKLKQAINEQYDFENESGDIRPEHMKEYNRYADEIIYTLEYFHRWPGLTYGFISDQVSKEIKPFNPNMLERAVYGLISDEEIIEFRGTWNTMQDPPGYKKGVRATRTLYKLPEDHIFK